MNIQKIASSESARQDIYQALAGCYCLPQNRLNENLFCLKNRLKQINSPALPYADNMISEMDSRPIDLLVVEYTRLFIGPFSLPAPPYGSVYIEKERKVMGDSTMDALKRYQQFDLDLASGLKEVPDHITIELEFMYFLISKEIESILSSDPELSQVYLTAQTSFLTDHLNGWIPDFTKNMITHSGIEFYRSLAKMTKIFVSEDLQFLQSVCKTAASQ